MSGLIRTKGAWPSPSILGLPVWLILRLLRLPDRLVQPLGLPQSCAMAWDGVALWAQADLSSFFHSIILTSSQQPVFLGNRAISVFCEGLWTWGSPGWEDAGTLVSGGPAVPSVDVRNVQPYREFLWVYLSQTDDICRGERSQSLLSITSLNVDNQQNSKSSSGL